MEFNDHQNHVSRSIILKQTPGQTLSASILFSHMNLVYVLNIEKKNLLFLIRKSDFWTPTFHHQYLFFKPIFDKEDRFFDKEEPGSINH